MHYQICPHLLDRLRHLRSGSKRARSVCGQGLNRKCKADPMWRRRVETPKRRRSRRRNASAKNRRSSMCLWLKYVKLIPMFQKVIRKQKIQVKMKKVIRTRTLSLKRLQLPTRQSRPNRMHGTMQPVAFLPSCENDQLCRQMPLTRAILSPTCSWRSDCLCIPAHFLAAPFAQTHV